MVNFRIECGEKREYHIIIASELIPIGIGLTNGVLMVVAVPTHVLKATLDQRHFQNQQLGVFQNI